MYRKNTRTYVVARNVNNTPSWPVFLHLQRGTSTAATFGGSIRNFHRLTGGILFSLASLCRKSGMFMMMSRMAQGTERIPRLFSNGHTTTRKNIILLAVRVCLASKIFLFLSKVIFSVLIFLSFHYTYSLVYTIIFGYSNINERSLIILILSYSLQGIGCYGAV